RELAAVHAGADGDVDECQREHGLGQSRLRVRKTGGSACPTFAASGICNQVGQALSPVQGFLFVHSNGRDHGRRRDGRARRAVAGPTVLAAVMARVPIIAMEPNAVPGVTNRRLGRYVRKTLLAFPEAARWFPAGRTEVTGLPVRAEFFAIASRVRGATLRVLITGGSAGSRTLNQAARQSWPLFRAANFPVHILHQTGREAFEETRKEFTESGIEGEVVPFI